MINTIDFINKIDDFLDIFLDTLAYYSWSPLSIFLLMGTGLFLSFKFRFIQLRYFRLAFRILIYGKDYDNKHTLKENLVQIEHDLEDVLETKQKSNKLTGFQALSTVLSGTIGTGNIAGVATAIAMGGPGSLFWMWVTGFLGMATKFCSCALAHHYRHTDKNNNIIGGPMITLLHGLNYKKLANIFAFFMLLGCLSTGSMVQANSIADGIDFLLPDLFDNRFYIGFTIAILCGIVIIGGVQRIANVATIIVPFMAIAYIITALSILVIHYYDVPKTFYLIFAHAFSIKAVAGTSFWLVIRSGVARGLFASEAGLGTAPIALATLDAKSPIEAGLVGMIGPVFDTLLICTMTGLIIMASGAYSPDSELLYTGAQLSQHAFALGFNCIGQNSSIISAWIVGIGLILFAFTTILTWSYYGDRCVSFLFGEKYILIYRFFFLFVLVMGAMLKLDVVWNLADIANIGMAVPNLIAVIMLRNKIKELLQQFINKNKS